MRRKNLLAIGLVSVCLLAGGCGSETAQQEETTEIVAEVTETEEEETTEVVVEETEGTLVETNNSDSPESDYEGLTEAEKAEAMYEDLLAADDGTEQNDELSLAAGKSLENSKWGEIHGKWDANHQHTLYAQSQGADYADGWWWIYENGSGAGDQPSYAVYMKEDSPRYGEVKHVGDYLDGCRFCGTNDEWSAYMTQGIVEKAEESGHEVTYDESTGRYTIHSNKND